MLRAILAPLWALPKSMVPDESRSIYLMVVDNSRSGQQPAPLDINGVRVRLVETGCAYRLSPHGAVAAQKVGDPDVAHLGRPSQRRGPCFGVRFIARRAARDQQLHQF